MRYLHRQARPTRMMEVSGRELVLPMSVCLVTPAESKTHQTLLCLWLRRIRVGQRSRPCQIALLVVATVDLRRPVMPHLFGEKKGSRSFWKCSLRSTGPSAPQRAPKRLPSEQQLTPDLPETLRSRLRPVSPPPASRISILMQTRCPCQEHYLADSAPVAVNN